jgi:predicted Fe-Mo cluster-binding NifX family protein
MKIAISISKSKEIYSQSEVFGRSSHFLFFNTISKEEKIISNPFYNEIGGAGIQSVQFLIKCGVDVLITRKIGRNPKRFLKLAKVKVFQCEEEATLEVLRLFIEGKLFEIKDIDGNFSSGRNRKRIMRSCRKESEKL